MIDITPRLLNILKRNPDEMRNLNPSQFEALITERIDRMGFNVTRVGSTYRKDGGIDFIATPRNLSCGTYLIAGQVKHHGGNKKTGREAVDRMLAWKGKEFQLGLLVTNTHFSKDALWLANQTGNKAFLRLRDFSDLKRWLLDNFSSDEEWREIPDQIKLAPGIIVDVPKPDIFIPGSGVELLDDKSLF